MPEAASPVNRVWLPWGFTDLLPAVKLRDSRFVGLLEVVLWDSDGALADLDLHLLSISLLSVLDLDSESLLSDRSSKDFGLLLETWRLLFRLVDSFSFESFSAAFGLLGLPIDWTFLTTELTSCLGRWTVVWGCGFREDFCGDAVDRGLLVFGENIGGDLLCLHCVGVILLWGVVLLWSVGVVLLWVGVVLLCSGVVLFWVGGLLLIDLDNEWNCSSVVSDSIFSTPAKNDHEWKMSAVSN